MFRYETMICRACATTIAPALAEVDSPKTAGSYAECNFRCPNPACRVAFTNAKDVQQRRMIQPEAALNVPPAVRAGVAKVLATSLNIRNRPTKVKKFAFETSEDALTWTVFRYLWQRGEIGQAVGLDEVQPDSVHFWGTRWPRTAEPDALRDELCGILTGALGERASSLSEPDLILEDADHLVIVEVKFGSQNDSKPDYRGFAQYLRDAARLFCRSAEDVTCDGYYELARNWVAGSALAERRQRTFTLVNLAGESCRESSDAFEKSLLQSTDRRYRFVSWPELIVRLTRPLENWLSEYLHARGLLRRES